MARKALADDLKATLAARGRAMPERNKETNRLDDLTIKSKVAEARAEGRRIVLHDGGQLYLAISPKGSAAWRFNYRLAGKAACMGLGPYPATTLNRARVKRAEAITQLKDYRQDPLAPRRIEKAELAAKREEETRAAVVAKEEARTFRTVADKWLQARHGATLDAKPWAIPTKHAAGIQSRLRRFALPVIGDVPIGQVSVRHVKEVLDRDHGDGPIWHSAHKSANLARCDIAAILTFAEANEWRSGTNPFGDDIALTVLDKVNWKTKPNPALPWPAMPAFIAKLRQWDTPVTGVADAHLPMAVKALEFQVLTAARTIELFGGERTSPARWVNIKDGIWIIPATKNDKLHSVPVTARMAEILASLGDDHGPDDLIFAGSVRRDLNNLTKAICETEAEWRDPQSGELPSAHGHRSTFSDWARAQGYDKDLYHGTATNHKEQDATTAAYVRGHGIEPRHREMLEAWAAFCDGRAADAKAA